MSQNLGLDQLIQAFKRFAALSGGETRWQLTSHEAGWRVFETCSRYRDIYSTPSDTIFPRRVFKEVGIILTQPQRVFHRLMDVGDSRMQWDTTCSRLSILDRVDKFTDTIELASGGKDDTLKSQVRRFWSYQPDGTFIIILTKENYSKVREYRRW
mmetsp:Transcript_3848/g.16904  ORF Transcript_3848/g.16904 Transcript_3848/m.16904 type:complete len:155 (-) Transcript_3848:683-1147(-)